MKLSRLLSVLPEKQIFGPTGIEIAHLVADSRRVQPGDLFVAIRGLSADGHAFIGEAIDKGATAIVAETLPSTPLGPQTPSTPLTPSAPSPPSVPFVLVPNSRQALAHLSAAWHHHPARRLRVVGVTGTDGKTTTITLIRAILETAGHRVGMISTVSALIGGMEIDTGFHTTTPDALEVQGYLAQMVTAGAEYALIEATSHGLAQHRVTACDFDVAVVTNITHEHLDYHGSYEEYRQAKARLFRDLATAHHKPDTPKVAVLNADDASYAFLRLIPAEVQLSYGLHPPAEVRAEDVRSSPQGLRFRVLLPHADSGPVDIESPLLGLFNVPNILAAVSVGLSQGLPVEAMQEGIRTVKGVTGRMERVDVGQDFTVMIDFAHTPNALERALETARELTEGRVIVVFGCAGLRDRVKRPLMGEVAGRLAERVVITAEDPRTESLKEIVAQIAAGCEKAGRREGIDYWRIGDRGEAIAFAIGMARPGDLVIVTGKGHERTMCFGTTEHPWSDHQAVINALPRHPVPQTGPG